MKKRFLLMALPMMAMLTYSSCSKDDDGCTCPNNQTQNNSNQNGSNGQGNGQTVDAEQSAAQGVTVNGKIGQYTYVDLGLPGGLLWATYNVGATSPTESGHYLRWGETKPKEDEESYDSSITEEYVKSLNWGDKWRMPTEEEMRQLVESCYWQWLDNYNGSGRGGYVGRSVYNLNMIFLPATDNDHGKYWTSSLLTDPFYMEFYGISLLPKVWYDGCRSCHYYSVRLVCPAAE